MEIPVAFAQGVLQDGGAEWLAALPSQFQQACQRWALEVEGPPRHGYLGLAFPVRHQGEAAVLKLTRIDQETRDEAAALRLWGGRGAVRLLDASPGVLLLERLDATRTLAGARLEEAVEVASRLLRRLSIATCEPFLEMNRYACELHQLAQLRWHIYQPFPQEWLRLPAVRQDLLVNQDLHYDNVLAGEREDWLVIDPKPLRGDPEFAVAPLLWNRSEEGAVLDRLEQIVQVAKLDRSMALEWSIFRVLEYWLWALSLGFTEDPGRCQALAEQLLRANR